MSLFLESQLNVFNCSYFKKSIRKTIDQSLKSWSIERKMWEKGAWRRGEISFSWNHEHFLPIFSLEAIKNNTSKSC